MKHNKSLQEERPISWVNCAQSMQPLQCERQRPGSHGLAITGLGKINFRVVCFFMPENPDSPESSFAALVPDIRSSHWILSSAFNKYLVESVR